MLSLAHPWPLTASIRPVRTKKTELENREDRTGDQKNRRPEEQEIAGCRDNKRYETDEQALAAVCSEGAGGYIYIHIYIYIYRERERQRGAFGEVSNGRLTPIPPT